MQLVGDASRNMGLCQCWCFWKSNNCEFVLVFLPIIFTSGYSIIIGFFLPFHLIHVYVLFFSSFSVFVSWEGYEMMKEMDDA